MHSGIYKITNTLTGKCYIGSAVNVEQRWRQHHFALKRGTHHSQYLQRAWGKHGSEMFVFSRLITCSRENLLTYEQLCLDAYQPEYNILKVAGSGLGTTISPAQKAVLSSHMKARVQRDPAAHAAVTKLAHQRSAALHSDPKYKQWLSRRFKETLMPKFAKYVTFQGETLTIEAWSERTGIKYNTLKTRLQRWSVEEALTTPSKGKMDSDTWTMRSRRNGIQLFPYLGEELTVTKLAARLGTSPQALREYLKTHSLEDSIAHYTEKAA